MQKGLKIETNKITLYDTVVLEKSFNEVKVKTGGFITASTRKAINTGFELFGLDFKASIKGGVLYVAAGGKSFPVEGELIYRITKQGK